MSFVLVDDRDRSILSALARNSRMSFRDLGQIANLSANATAERVQRLQDNGVITKFSIDIPASVFGLGLQAFIDVKLQPGMSMADFEKSVSRIENVIEGTVLTGKFDARLRVAVEGPEHLNHLIELLRAAHFVQETNSTIICKKMNFTEHRNINRLPLK